MCPAQYSSERDYSLVSRAYPKPAFTVEQLRAHGYDVGKLVGSYVEGVLDRADEQSVAKIGLMATADVNQEVHRL